MSIPASFITSTALWFSFPDASVPAEQTIRFGSNDCKKPCAIWLRQLLPVHKIKIFILFTFTIIEVNIFEKRFERFLKFIQFFGINAIVCFSSFNVPLD